MPLSEQAECVDLFGAQSTSSSDHHYSLMSACVYVSVYVFVSALYPSSVALLSGDCKLLLLPVANGNRWLLLQSRGAFSENLLRPF